MALDHLRSFSAISVPCSGIAPPAMSSSDEGTTVAHYQQLSKVALLLGWE